VLNDYNSFAGFSGGHTRTRGLYLAVREWSPVVFVSFSSNGNLQVGQFDKNITVITVPKSSDHISELQHLNAYSQVSADDIVAGRHCWRNPYLGAIYRVLRQLARCIVVEHCYMAGLPGIWGDRFVYSSQNNETELKKKLLESHPLKAELLRDVERMERFAVECSAATIAVSQEDAKSLVRGKRTAGPVIVVRNGAAVPAVADTLSGNLEAWRDKIDARSVVFLGSAHMPNVEAAQYITERIAHECHDVQFHLIGSVCNAIYNVPANVHLWGVVDDVTKSAVMQSCALAINPILDGGGSNVKLADYIGHGLFVITTKIGQRGYPSSIQEHVQIASPEQFPVAILSALTQPELFSAQVRLTRRKLFDRDFSMQSLAKRFVDTLRGLEVKKKRVLYVVYRYSDPPLGGAEVNMERFISALGHSGQFDVDVVAPEISGIHSFKRFSEVYSFDQECGVPIDIPNVRFARFPIDTPLEAYIDNCLQAAWGVQPRFEAEVSQLLASEYASMGLTWGWGFPEGVVGATSRWAFTECGIFLAETAQLQIDGHASSQITITALSRGMVVAGPWVVDGNFRLNFEAPAGELDFYTSAPTQPQDPRPLGFHVNNLTVADKGIDLSASTLIQQHLARKAEKTTFYILDRAAAETRVAQNVRLTDGRGPWSTSLERYFAEQVAEYDLVVTHNNVFKPAVVAINEAKKQGVPSILIPHAHLDDDFYHFPDLLESAQNASLVLAASNAACDFLASKGCNVRYLPAGCDTEEEFSQQDVESFMQIFPIDRQFALILGRKADAKGYRKIIDAVKKLNRDGVNLHLVLIGPDDDGFPIDSPNATYLGRQPRNVVRGALMSCIALCNMSSSESFGIVLLEAWQAGKPVIANKNCAAFRNIAVDGVNALMATDDNLAEKLHQIASDAELRERLARNGKAICDAYGWKAITKKFVSICNNEVSL